MIKASPASLRESRQQSPGFSHRAGTVGLIQRAGLFRGHLGKLERLGTVFARKPLGDLLQDVLAQLGPGALSSSIAPSASVSARFSPASTYTRSS